MLSVLLSWVYIILISYIWGTAFLGIIGRESSYFVKSRPAVLLAGLGTLTVYAQFFSLFYKVSLLANVVMLIITLLFAVLFFEKLRREVNRLKEEITLPKAILITILIVLFAYGTSKGFMHYDSDLYHAQSIRWIEEFGVVKGLGNLHTRLAYNSSSFCLSALFSFSFLKIQSFHTISGLYALILMLICLKLFTKDNFFKVSLSNVARIVALYYLFNVFDEMVAPASDYVTILMVLSTVILFLDLWEDGVDDYYPYALLSLLGVIIFTTKISGGFIVLIAIYPIIALIRNKDIRSVIRFLLSGIIAVVPFLIRNYILSGYLIYPVYQIDLFNPEHKIPNGLAWYDATEIKMYGRGHKDITRDGESLLSWLPDWFRSLDAVNKVSFLLAIAGLLLLVGLIVRAIIKKESSDFKKYLIIVTVNVCFIGWLLSSPLIRYGCVFLWLSPALCLGDIYMLFISKHDKTLIYKAFISLFFVYKAISFSKEFVTEFSTEYMLCQQDYGKFEAIEYTLHDMTFYYPVEGDRLGYDYFPSAPIRAEDIFIGNSIKDGFKDVTH